MATPLEQSSLTATPAFIIGPYRSGTTLLRYILDSHSQLAVPPESDFVQHLAALVADDESALGLQSLGFDREHVSIKARELANYFFASYAGSLGKPRWIDKSPLYAEHLRELVGLFPDAQFVMIHRHPLDVVESFTKGGVVQHRALAPYLHEREDLRLSAARYWAARTETMIDLGPSVKSTSITYEGLCKSPASEVRRILEFLGEEWEPQVLEFNRKPHDLGKESIRIRATTGFEPRHETYLQWPREVRAQAWEIVRDVAIRIGYKEYIEP